MADPTGFMKFKREDIDYRSVEERRDDFREIYAKTPSEKVKTQASRCMDCGVPFCQGDNGCPLGNLIPEWNDLTSQDKTRAALDRLHATNNFPEFTGYLCPAPCESACVLGLTSDAVAIKSIEKHLVDAGFENGWISAEKTSRRTGKKIAIIGSGPAGLAAAQELARAGHDVTVFEKAALPGGLLRYGIPDFKMEKHRIDRRIFQMQEEGVSFKTGAALGSNIHLSELQASYDAVGLALGAEQPRDLSVPGRELKGIHFAMDYLIAQNHATLSGKRSSIDAFGKRVIVIGGGDTGSDCLGTATRQGAASVLQFEIMAQPPHQRSNQTPWPLWPLMLRKSHAHEEGGTRAWQINTREFISDPNGHVQSLIAERISAAKEKVVFEADLVLLAMGFTGPRQQNWMMSSGLRLNDRGSIATDENLMTSVRGVFAAGDCRRGASLIVWAIAEGRKMAHAMNDYLFAHAIQDVKKKPRELPVG